MICIDEIGLTAAQNLMEHYEAELSSPVGIVLVFGFDTVGLVTGEVVTDIGLTYIGSQIAEFDNIKVRIGDDVLELGGKKYFKLMISEVNGKKWPLIQSAQGEENNTFICFGQ
jgi:hypothetical protein